MTNAKDFAQRPMQIKRSAWFEAAHHLHACNKDQGYTSMHGHSFLVTLTLKGQACGPNGWVADLACIGEALQIVRSELDHKCLNDIKGLQTPSLENLCAWIAARVHAKLPLLHSVEVARPSLNESCILQL